MYCINRFFYAYDIMAIYVVSSPAPPISWFVLDKKFYLVDN